LNLAEVTIEEFSNEWQLILKMIKEAAGISEWIMKERERWNKALYLETLGKS
jgi:hypothetical protein